MRKIREKTILTALVNLKCVGYFGKCMKSLTRDERGAVIDELIARGYIDDRMHLTPSSMPIIRDNLHLCQY